MSHGKLKLFTFIKWEIDGHLVSTDRGSLHIHDPADLDDRCCLVEDKSFFFGVDLLKNLFHHFLTCFEDLVFHDDQSVPFEFVYGFLFDFYTFFFFGVYLVDYCIRSLLL